MLFGVLAEISRKGPCIEKVKWITKAKHSQLEPTTIQTFQCILSLMSHLKYILCEFCLQFQLTSQSSYRPFLPTK